MYSEQGVAEERERERERERRRRRIEILDGTLLHNLIHSERGEKKDGQERWSTHCSYTQSLGFRWMYSEQGEAEERERERER